MIDNMKSRLFRYCAASLIALILLTPGLTLASHHEQEREMIDGRYEGYATNTSLESNSGGMTWTLFVLLSVLGMAGLFKNARRTHLD